MELGHIAAALADGQDVGLLVAKTAHGKLHAGIVFRWRGEVRLYHQAWHHVTRVGRHEDEMAAMNAAGHVVSLHIRRDRAKAVVGHLNDLTVANPNFPYSLKYDARARTDANLGRLVSPDGVGLNCVTFVLAVLNGINFRLLDGVTWPTDRPEDLEAQRRLVDYLAGTPGVTPEHLEAVRGEVGCMRVRPEELGACGCFLKFPVGFHAAAPASLYIRGLFDTPVPATPSAVATTSAPIP